MSFKTTYILFAILIGFFVVLGVVLWLGPSGGASTSPYLFPSLNPADGKREWEKIQEVEITHSGGQKLTFTRASEPQKWLVNGYRANAQIVNEVIKSVATSRRDIHAEKPPNLAAWGLAEPRATVVMKGAGEQKLTIGGESLGETNGVIYALASEHGQDPLAVPKSQLGGVLKPLSYFREPNLLGEIGSEFSAASLSEGQAKLGVKRKDLGRWVYTDGYTGDADPGSGGDGDPTKPIDNVGSLLNSLVSLKVDNKDEDKSDFVADEVTDFAPYNLDPAKGPVLRIEVQRDESRADKDAKKAPPTVLLVGVGKTTGDKSDKYFARLENEKSVVRVSAAVVDRIRSALKSPERLRDRHLLQLDDGPAVDAIDIDRIGDKLEFRKVSDGQFQPKHWVLLQNGQSLKVSDPAVQGIMTLLSGQLAADKIDYRPLSQEGELIPKDGVQAIVRLWVNALEEPKQEKKEGEAEKPKPTTPPVLKADKKDKPAVKLTFGKIIPGVGIEKQVAVKREVEGEPTALLIVPLDILEKIKQGPLFYLEKDLPRFNPPSLPPDTDITRLQLSLEGGSKVYDIAREKKEDPWKFTSPDSLKGRFANTDSVLFILDAMNRLEAFGLVNDKPTEKELDDTYGLKNPKSRVTITLTKEGKTIPFVYEFGRDFVTDPRLVYARQVFPKDQGGRDMVFTVEKTRLEALGRELQDMTIFKYDPADARTVKISGWNSTFGISLELASKDGSTWTVVEPKNFSLDGSKLVGLIRTLSSLKAERVVSRGAGANNPDYGFDPKKDALELEVILKDGKAHKLIVGSPSGDTGFYALQGNDVFVIAKSIFADLKASPKPLRP